MNTNKMQKLLALILALTMVMTMAAPIGVNAAEESWTIQSDTAIFLVKNSDTEENYDALCAQVRLFSSELAEKVTTTPLDIVYGEASQASTNDIILILDKNSGVAAQGYQVTVGTAVTITASDADGLFYGCRYLIKKLLLDGSVSAVSDAPWVGERTVSLDNGRKYFTVDWIKKLIREMSWANMNTLVLHFSEDMGLGIESKLYPWLAGRDGTLCAQADLGSGYDSRYLTQEEVVEIIQYAKLYHIDVIPSLDSPGHMNYIVKKFNEQCATQPFSFTYDGVTYTAPAGHNIGNYFEYKGQKTAVVPGSRNTAYSRGINIADEIAVAFTKSLIEEYANLFASQGCTKFDIGGDELLGWGSAVTTSVAKWKQLDHWKRYAQNQTSNNSAVAYDAFLLYMNDLNALVRELGYTSVRMWNDDALRSSDTGWTGVVQLDTNIDIWYWTTGTTFDTYADAGHKVYNILGDYNYYAMTANYFSENRSSFTQAYADQIYNEWSPYAYGSGGNAEKDDTRVLGGAFGIWCDNPTLRTEEQIMNEALPLIRANAAKSWDPEANSQVSYTNYTANWATYGAAPEGTVPASEIYVIPDLTALKEAVDAFSAVDSTLYTEESFAAYAEAVEAGQIVLNAAKPTQAQADAAAKDIQDAKAALAVKPAVDTAALNQEIETFDSMEAVSYTVESFAAYQKAVNDAKQLLNRTSISQSDIDDALANIRTAKDGLTQVTVSSVECIMSASSKASRGYAGKNVTFSVSTKKDVEVSGLAIYDDRGNLVTITKYTQNTKKADRNCSNVIFKLTANDRGTRTYTIYAILEDGSRSADFIQLTLSVL